jgi:uncharacterized protein
MWVGKKSLEAWESLFQSKIEEISGHDPAHDLAHFLRVVESAKRLGLVENAKMEVLIPAAWLHDFVNVPKNDPRRSQASRLSAIEATQYLREIEYPEEFYSEIAHAIEAHSYSAGIEAKTLEAQIVQDADRLDGLGAIGIARMFSVGGLLERRIYDPLDPFAMQGRELNDLTNTIDHFYVKLFKTVDTLKTAAGRLEGQRRAEHMRRYLAELAQEIGAPLRS